MNPKNLYLAATRSGIHYLKVPYRQRLKEWEHHVLSYAARQNPATCCCQAVSKEAVSALKRFVVWDPELYLYFTGDRSPVDAITQALSHCRQHREDRAGAIAIAVAALRAGGVIVRSRSTHVIRNIYYQPACDRRMTNPDTGLPWECSPVGGREGYYVKAQCYYGPSFVWVSERRLRGMLAESGLDSRKKLNGGPSQIDRALDKIKTKGRVTIAGEFTRFSPGLHEIADHRILVTRSKAVPASLDSAFQFVPSGSSPVRRFSWIRRLPPLRDNL